MSNPLAKNQKAPLASESSTMRNGIGEQSGRFDRVVAGLQHLSQPATLKIGSEFNPHKPML